MPKVKKEPKPYTGICCARCYTAKSEKKKCKCRCHGVHHGEARTKDAKSEAETCPKCGSKQVHETQQIWSPEGTVASKCDNCYHTWYKPKTL